MQDNVWAPDQQRTASRCAASGARERRGVSPVTLHRAARHQRPAVDQHEENQPELLHLLHVCFGAYYGLKSDNAPSPKSAKRRHSPCAASKVEIAPPRAARTLADLDNAQKVAAATSPEALSYRALVDDVRLAAWRRGHPLGIDPSGDEVSDRRDGAASPLPAVLSKRFERNQAVDLIR